MDSRARRIAENEILSREANTQMRWLDEELRTVGDTRYDFLCECGLEDCSEHLRLTLEEYESAHSDQRQFTIVDGHEIPGVEDVVERREAYTVVRKHEGEMAELAAEHAPG